jgi:hypothetical protein
MSTSDSSDYYSSPHFTGQQSGNESTDDSTGTTSASNTDQEMGDSRIRTSPRTSTTSSRTARPPFASTSTIPMQRNTPYYNASIPGGGGPSAPVREYSAFSNTAALPPLGSFALRPPSPLATSTPAYTPNMPSFDLANFRTSSAPPTFTVPTFSPFANFNSSSAP